MIAARWTPSGFAPFVLDTKPPEWCKVVILCAMDCGVARPIRILLPHQIYSDMLVKIAREHQEYTEFLVYYATSSNIVIKPEEIPERAKV